MSMSLAGWASAYHAAGWTGVFPLQPGAKFPPPAGVTGSRGEDIDPAQLVSALLVRPDVNLALHLPVGVIGLDVDEYEDPKKPGEFKHGAGTLAQLESDLGSLPATWQSTRRGDGITPGNSAIRFFRVPDDFVGVGGLPGIELIQRHHRYAVVAPSVVTERQYAWYSPNGESGVPVVAELPGLPAAWVARLDSGNAVGGASDPAGAEGLIAAADTDEEPCAAVRENWPTAELFRGGGARHDAMVAGQARLTHLAAAGHRGVGAALAQLAELFEDATGGGRDHEFSSALEGAWNLAAGALAADGRVYEPGMTDPCEWADELHELWAQRPQPRPSAGLPSDSAQEGPTAATAPIPAARLYPTLPEPFWAARPVFGVIRRAAWSRYASPDAVLHIVLARLAAFASSGISFDSGIASGRLNYYVALVGASGEGKSESDKCATDLFPLPAGVSAAPKPLGSGEGVAESFMGTVEVPARVGLDGKPGKPLRVRQQVRHNVLLVMDEGQALVKMFERSGPTIGPALRTAWSGGTLGQTNGTDDRTRHVERGTYNLAFTVGFQPSVMGPLLDQADTGMPQRFVYTAILDATAPRAKPAWPGTIEVPEWVWWHARPANPNADAMQLLGQMPAWKPMTAAPPLVVTVDEDITEELSEERHSVLTGRLTRDEMDSQAPLLRLKVAALLALLDGRDKVTTEDWSLARTIWETSNAVRTALVGHVAGQRAVLKAARMQDSHDQAYAARAGSMTAEDGVEQAAVARVATTITRRIQQLGEATRRDVMRAVASRDKAYRDAAVELALSTGAVVESDGVFTPGEQTP